MDHNFFAAEGSIIRGDVEIGEDSSLWYHTVLRGDKAPIRVGRRTNLQDCCVVHVDAGYPVQIGDDVTVGHSAVIHGCTIGDNTVIGMGAILLNGAKVGRNCIIGAGSLVTSGKEIPDGMLAFGNPAKVIRPLTPEEIRHNQENSEEYVQLSREERIHR